MKWAVFIAIMTTVVILYAIINWKMSAEQAEKPSRIVNVIFITTIVLFPNLGGIWRSTDGDMNNLFLFFLIILMTHVLIFITTDVLQYAKNKTDINAMRKMIKQTIIFVIVLMGMIAGLILIIVAINCEFPIIAFVLSVVAIAVICYIFGDIFIVQSTYRQILIYISE